MSTRSNDQEARRYVCGHRLPTLEADALEVLLAAEQPLTVGEVQQRLAGGRRAYAYTTVATILGRLAGRGLAVQAPAGRAHRWSPAADRRGLAELALEQVLSSVEDPEAALLGFLRRTRRARKER